MLAATPQLVSTLWLGPQIADMLQTVQVGHFFEKNFKIEFETVHVINFNNKPVL